MLSPVSTGMGDRPGSTPGAALYFGMQLATQVDSAFYPLWDGKMMLCGWGVKAGMTCLQVKLCVAIPERFGKCYSI